MYISEVLYKIYLASEVCLTNKHANYGQSVSANCKVHVALDLQKYLHTAQRMKNLAKTLLSK